MRAVHGGKNSMELGEKAGEKRRAMVGLGLVRGGGNGGRKPVRKNRVGAGEEGG